MSNVYAVKVDQIFPKTGLSRDCPGTTGRNLTWFWRYARMLMLGLCGRSVSRFAGPDRFFSFQPLDRVSRQGIVSPVCSCSHIVRASISDPVSSMREKNRVG